MSETDTPTKEYPVYDHDSHGAARPDVDQGRVYYDEAAGKLMCEMHGDTVATDGSATRPVFTAPIVDGPDGMPFRDQSKATKTGDARLYKCTVCGQGTWSEKG